MNAATIVHINPDVTDPRNCGRCTTRGPQCSGRRASKKNKVDILRGPECLRAERLLADLRAAARITAGTLRDGSAGHGHSLMLDAALAAIDAAGKAAR